MLRQCGAVPQFRSMQQLGMIHKVDVAPPGYMEDRLSQFIDMLEMAER